MPLLNAHDTTHWKVNGCFSCGDELTESESFFASDRHVYCQGCFTVIQAAAHITKDYGDQLPKVEGVTSLAEMHI